MGSGRDHQGTDQLGPLRTAWGIVRLYPREASQAIVLLLLAGIAESVGVMTLLPLLRIAGGQAGGDPITNVLDSAMAAVGLHASVYTLSALIVLTLSLKGLLFMLAMRKAGYVGADAATTLRFELTDALMNARWTYFISQPAGAFTNALGTEALRVSMMVTYSCYFAARVIQAALYLVLAIFVSWYVTIGGIIAGTALFSALGFLIRRAKRAGIRQTELYQEQSTRLADSLTGFKALRAMGRLEGVKKFLHEGSSNLDAAYRRQVSSEAMLTSIQEPFIALFLAAGIVITLGIVDLPLVKVIFMAAVFQRVMTRLTTAQVSYQLVAANESAYRSLRSSIDEALRVREDNEGRRLPTLKRGVTFVGVSFNYESSPVISDLNLFIPAGRLTAILGPSGVGKTTVVDLLTGLLKPQAGDISVDGVSLAEIDLERWRNEIGYVPQETILLHASVVDNILLDHKGLTLTDVERALRQAEAWEFVAQLPEGINTLVGERGIRLSGGQRQRIGLARSLIHRPSLLVLDEATTGLDPNMERSILATLQRLTPSTTLVCISHQEALIAAADLAYRLRRQGAEVIKKIDQPTSSPS